MKNDSNKPRPDVDDTVDATVDGGGMVEKLLHAAGPGPEIPDGGGDKVKDLIRPAWQEQVASRSRQRSRLWISGLAAAAALIVAMVYLPTLQPNAPAPVSRPITLAMIKGTIEVTPPGSNVVFLTSETVGAEIPRGSLIRTGSRDRAALWLTDHRSIRLDVETELQLDSEASISLASGALYIDSQNGSVSGIEVRTSLGTATDIGTQFEVRLGLDTIDVRVREGLVSLVRNEEEFQITQGVALSVDADGQVHSTSLTAYDPLWAWTQDIAPIFDIEGQTVLAFLDWVSGETGLSIGFASAEVEQLAATTILHGSIEGLSPAEAPAAILPSARLAITHEPGALLVTSPREPGGGP
jgi:hypothetical protein